MIKVGHRVYSHPSVAELIKKEDKLRDPAEIIREKARRYVKIFYGGLIPGPPFSPKYLASFMGIRLEYQKPSFSNEAELIPERGGRLLIQCNPKKPKARQNFSIFHELAHTFFPNFKEVIGCRRAKKGERNELERLCDLAAAELLLPLPWFEEDVEKHGFSASSIPKLARRYDASREAVTIRMVQSSAFPCAAIFFSWKYKSSQRGKIRREKNQGYLFPCLESNPQKALRVDFAISSHSFQYFIPKSKSVDKESLIYKTALKEKSYQGRECLNLGTLQGKFYLETLPLDRGYQRISEPSPVIALIFDKFGK